MDVSRGPVNTGGGMEEGLQETLLQEAKEDQRERKDSMYGEELAVQYWDIFSGAGKSRWPPDIFAHNNVKIANDGGIADVKKLIYPVQYFYAALMLGFFVANAYMITRADLEAIWPNIWGQEEENELKLLNSQHEARRKFLLTRAILKSGLGWTWLPLIDHHLSKLVPLLEFSVMYYQIFQVFRYSYCALRARHIYKEHTEFQKWIHVVHIYWDLLPQMASFSAMRLLYYVTPSVLGTEGYVCGYLVMNRMASANNPWEKLKAILPLLWYLFTRTVAFIIGFDAFLVKYRMATPYIDAVSFDSTSVITSLVFLFQLLGVVNLNWFVRSRLFIFMFAGEEGNLDHQEQARIKVFQCLLAREIYRVHGLVKGTIIMCGFDDYDFQMLVLDPREKKN
mmetsp:Transcript_35355/g.77327  ORF Transcript_35355/g.77327 Transcript_35355/m.77327 type:complete len:394 (+) Transcript_35355:96-1277(+)|eukprot:CAMPEP_0170596732 /NCGR_PEP_ID=MMETSP0224-20130122/15297_1 /TAXON_ID=285029 /ORGANISM="Togula jolla, Strain CCCM 725" /LENGTH=393 /DNA_ID=CAMNT_0010921089 /DNA_START=96 /DNA_END=1277 /DNA_ORIENTATION=-